MSRWNRSSLRVPASLVLLGACSVPAAGAAPDPPQRSFLVEPVPADVRHAEGFDAGESSGLFVGIHRFDDEPFPPVLFAADDAVDLAHLFALELGLVAPERVVLSLSGAPRKEESLRRLHDLIEAGAARKTATQAEIYRQLRALGKSTGPRGLFIVAMATHGIANMDGDFLVGADSLSWHLPRTGIAVGEVFSIVGESTAPRRLVLLDACRERGTSANARSVSVGSEMSPTFADAISQATGQVVLFGATRGGFAYDDPDQGNGVFASAVINGLRGAAPTDDRFFITAGTLAEYVHEEVLDWVSRKRPQHAHLSRGISTHLEGGAARIPLAFDPYGHEVVEDYRHRLDGALGRLRRNIGGPHDPDNPITGAVYDQVVRALDTGYPTPALLELLEAAEALDGTVHTQRGLAYVYEKNKGQLGARPTAHTSPRRMRTDKVRRRTEPRQGDRWKDPVAEIDFLYVPPGSYQAGSHVDEAGRDPDETPHRVTLSRGFWMASTEVTMVQFARFVAETGYATEAEEKGFSKVWEDGAWKEKEEVDWRESGGLDRPVAHVSWNDVLAFCEWLSQRTGKVVRLPTEAEWEYAARAGTRESTYAGDLTIQGSCVASELDEIAWYCGNSMAGTHAVARKKPNPWGLYDVLGNTSEWVADRFGLYPEASLRDPAGPDRGESRVVRGGSAFFAARSNRAASRSGIPASESYSYLGFRVALSSAK